MAYSAIGETSDGVVHLGLVGGGLQRISSSSRVAVAQLGRRVLYQVTATVAAETAPSAAEVRAFHRDGWAVAVRTVTAAEAALWGVSTSTVRLEVWQYEAGNWSVVSATHVLLSLTALEGRHLRIYIREDELYLEVLNVGTFRVRRGSSLLGVAVLTFINEAWARISSGDVLWRNEFVGIGSVTEQFYPDIVSWLCAVASGSSVHAMLEITAQDYTHAVTYWWQAYDGAYQLAQIPGEISYLSAGLSGRAWGVGPVSSIYVIEGLTGGTWVYAGEQDGVEGLIVEGSSNPDADGFYAPGDPVNGQPSWVSENGEWWIIWDGTQWVIAPTGETEGAYVTVLDDELQNVVVSEAEDASCAGEYAPGDPVNGQPSWNQVDGDHSIIWDGTQWVLVDGEGTVIYEDGSGAMPWQGLWADPEGGAGPIVAGRMTESESALAPGAGEHVRYMSETDTEEAAVAARLVIRAPAADVAQMRALVRFDRTTEARDAWTTYRYMPLAPAIVTPDTPATTVEVAIIKPKTMDEPDVRLETRRFEE